MPYSPFVNNPSAENIFNAMICYITDPSYGHLESAEDVLSKASALDLGAISPDGRTHLIELFSHTFKIHENDRSAVGDIVTSFFYLLMKYSEKFPGIKKELLLPSHRGDVLPFFHILSVGAVVNVFDYLDETLKLFPGEEYKAPYKALLTRTTKKDGSILHVVFNSNDPRKITFLFDRIDAAITEGILTHEDLNRMLITTNKAGNSALHCAMASDHGYLLLDRLPKVRANGLSNDVYKGLLINFNTGRFTPLTQCLKTGDNRTLETYFLMVHQALRENVITKNEFRELLISRTTKNFSTLQAVFDSTSLGRLEKIKLFLKQLDDAFDKGIISGNVYKDLLLKSQRPGMSFIYVVLLKTDPETLMLYFQVVNKAHFTHALITAEEYEKLLLEVSTGGYTPLSSAIKTGTPKQIIALLSILREAKNARLLTREKYYSALVGPNYAGYTMLDEILKADNPDVLPFYFKLVHEARNREQGESIIIDDRFKLLFLNVNQGDSTSFEYALSRSSETNLLEYMKALKQAVSDGFITSIEYGALLTRSNKRRYTPLTSASFSSNSTMLRHYLTLLDDAKEKGLIKHSDYESVLTTSTTEKFTPLHSILNLRDEESLYLFLEALKAAKIRTEKLHWLLTTRDNYDCSPLDKALYTGKLSVVRLYLKALESVTSIIPNDELESFLVKSGLRGLAPISSAIHSNNPDILKTYIDFVNDIRTSRHIIKEAAYLALLTTPCKSSGLTPLHHAIFSGNYDLVHAFFMILEPVIGSESLKEELHRTYTTEQGITFYYCRKKAKDSERINNLIASLRRGHPLLLECNDMSIGDPASHTESLGRNQYSPFKRRRQFQPATPDGSMAPALTPSSDTTGPTPGQNITQQLYFAMLSPPAVQRDVSTVSPAMLKHIEQITAQSSSTGEVRHTPPVSEYPFDMTHIPPRDFVADTKGKMVAIAQAMVGRYGIHPDQISFYGSAAQLMVGHRSLSDAPADIDVRLFAYEQHWIDLRKNFKCEQPSISIYGNDSDPFLLMKGFSLPNIGSIDIQVILMKNSETLLACRERSRWTSYLNVCADYCTFISPDVIIPNPGPGHQRAVYFVGAQGQYRSDIEHLYQLYANPLDLKAKDLFFFLKKWHYFKNAGYEVSALKRALINTIAYGHGFNLATTIFSTANRDGKRMGAEILCDLSGDVYCYHRDDVFDTHYQKLLQEVDDKICAVLFDNPDGATRVLPAHPDRATRRGQSAGTLPTAYPHSAYPHSAYPHSAHPHSAHPHSAHPHYFFSRNSETEEDIPRKRRRPDDEDNKSSLQPRY